MKTLNFGLMRAMASIMAAQHAMPLINQQPITSRMYPNYGGGVTIPASVKFSSGKRVPYRIDGPIQEARRDRRSRVTSARQQRKARKAWNAEQRADHAINKMVSDHEKNADWQEDEMDRNAFEQEKRADDLYEEHFS